MLKRYKIQYNTIQYNTKEQFTTIQRQYSTITIQDYLDGRTVTSCQRSWSVCNKTCRKNRVISSGVCGIRSYLRGADRRNSPWLMRWLPEQLLDRGGSHNDLTNDRYTVRARRLLEMLFGLRWRHYVRASVEMKTLT